MSVSLSSWAWLSWRLSAALGDTEYITEAWSSTQCDLGRKENNFLAVYICKLHTFGIEPVTCIFLDRWPTLCAPVDKLQFLHISARLLAIRCAGAVWLLMLKTLTAVKMLVWFTMILTSSCNSCWPQRHASLLCLPSVSVTLHRWQPLLPLGSLLPLVGSMAAFKTLKIHNNLTVWILVKSDWIFGKIQIKCCPYSRIYSKASNVTMDASFDISQHDLNHVTSST